MAAVAAGATALRIETTGYVRAVRPKVSMPVIGIVNRDDVGGPEPEDPDIGLITAITAVTLSD
ncbi:hypothetical protein [Martelella mangrovi]|uniref:N-acylglucosamine-6-phosphate 2-epimerase n=1 Tax=Martelella mangrovi TaxID=1397477 RepID=A0ABV2IEN5_9HYPH